MAPGAAIADIALTMSAELIQDACPDALRERHLELLPVR
jgi:hypothetical protein